MIIKKYILTLLILISVVSCFAQKQNDNISVTVNKIAKNNVYETTATVGFAGSASSQYQLFKTLLAVSTSEQLIAQATTNSNAVVRLYAFQALKRKNTDLPNSLIQKFKTDNSEVISLSGCIGAKLSVKFLSDEDIFTTPVNPVLIQEQ